MNNQFVSFCIPTYNRSSRLKKTLSILLKSTRSDFEVVIVDNASPDDTESVVESFNDPRITYYKNSSNIGATLNILRSMCLGRGEWVFTLSDEDEVTPEIIDSLFSILNEDHMKDVFVLLGTVKRANGELRIPLIYNDNIFPAGDEGVGQIGATHLYMSGVLIRKSCIPVDFEQTFSTEKHGLYPYVHAMTYAAKEHKVATSSQVVCIQHDRASVSYIELVDGKSFKYPSNRINQCMLFINLLNETISSDQIFQKAVLKLYDMYFYECTTGWLILVSKQSHIFRLNKVSFKHRDTVRALENAFIQKLQDTGRNLDFDYVSEHLNNKKATFLKSVRWFAHPKIFISVLAKKLNIKK